MPEHVDLERHIINNQDIQESYFFRRLPFCNKKNLLIQRLILTCLNTDIWVEFLTLKIVCKGQKDFVVAYNYSVRLCLSPS